MTTFCSIVGWLLGFLGTFGLSALLTDPFEYGDAVKYTPGGKIFVTLLVWPLLLVFLFLMLIWHGTETLLGWFRYRRNGRMG